MTGAAVPASWTTYTMTVSGTQQNGVDNPAEFRPGTAYIKPVMLVNYQGTAGNLVTWQNITWTLSPSEVGDVVNDQVMATEGTGAKSFAVSSGTLPTGLSLNGSSGALTGTVTTAGVYNFTITATDSVGATGSQSVRLDDQTGDFVEHIHVAELDDQQVGLQPDCDGHGRDRRGYLQHHDGKLAGRSQSQCSQRRDQRHADGQRQLRLYRDGHRYACAYGQPDLYSDDQSGGFDHHRHVAELDGQSDVQPDRNGHGRDGLRHVQPDDGESAGRFDPQSGQWRYRRHADNCRHVCLYGPGHGHGGRGRYGVLHGDDQPRGFDHHRHASELDDQRAIQRDRDGHGRDGGRQLQPDDGDPAGRFDPKCGRAA